MDGRILYCLIAKGTFVLAEYETVQSDAGNEDVNNLKTSSSRSSNPDLLGLESSHSRNNNRSQEPSASPHEDFASMARKALGKIRRTPGMHSYLYGSFMFTYVIRGDILLMCASHASLGRDAPSCFLTALLARPELVRTGEASVLTRVLRDMLECKSDSRQASAGLFGTASQLAEAEEKLDSVATVVKDNLRKVINRSENIDSLLCKASDLSTEAFSFRDSSRQLHRQLWWSNLRTRFTILTSVAIVFLVLVSFFFLCRTPWSVSDSMLCNRLFGKERRK